MERSSLLRPDEWLSAQPEAFRDAFSGLGRIRTLPAGAPLYRRDDWGGMYGVVSGCVEIDIEFPVSSIVGLHLAYPSYFIGIRPIKVGAPYAVTTAARTDSEVRVVTLAELQRMVEHHPEWWRCIAAITDHWFDVVACGMVDLMLRKPEARCIAVLLRLGGYRPCDTISNEARFVPITQTELADNANLSRSTVNEILARYDGEGLISRGYGGIDIIKPSGLLQHLNKQCA